MTTKTRSFTRRSLLRNAATGAASLALATAVLQPSASGKPASADKKKRKQSADKAVADAPGTASNDASFFSPEEIELGRAIAHKARHAFALAAANPGKSFAKGSLADTAAKLVARQPAKRKQRSKARAEKLLASASERKVKLGEYADADAEVHAKSGKDDGKLKKAAEKVAKKHKDDKKVDPYPGPSYKRIEFHLNSIRCRRETDDQWGADEILLSGHLVEPDGHIVKLDMVKYEDFETGEHRVFDYSQCMGDAGVVIEGMPQSVRKQLGICPHGGPKDPYRGRMLASSRLQGPYPSTWTLVLMMGEQDDGGFGTFINDTYESMQKEIKGALTGLLSTAGSYFGPIGTAIGAALAYALGELLDFIVSLFENEDDVIGARTWYVRLHGGEKSRIQKHHAKHLKAPDDTWATEMRKLEFAEKDGEGRYTVRFHWRVTA